MKKWSPEGGKKQIQTGQMKTCKSYVNPNEKKNTLEIVKTYRNNAKMKQKWKENGSKKNEKGSSKSWFWQVPTTTLEANWRGKKPQGSSESSFLQLLSASLKAKKLTWWENEKNENIWKWQFHLMGQWCAEGGNTWKWKGQKWHFPDLDSLCGFNLRWTEC